MYTSQIPPIQAENFRLYLILHNITRCYQNLLHAFPWSSYAPDKNSGHRPRKAMPCFSATQARGSVWWMWRNNTTRPRKGGGRFSATPHLSPVMQSGPISSAPRSRRHLPESRRANWPGTQKVHSTSRQPLKTLRRALMTY